MQEIQQEIATKVERVTAWLKEKQLDALLIRRNENLAWITAGILARRVLLPSDTNVCTILITKDGDRYYLSTNNEAARLADEDFAGLGFEPVIWPWNEDGQAAAIERLAGSAKLATDQAMAGASAHDLTALRTPLLAAELARYREAGKQVAAIVTNVLQQLQPGMTEFTMNGLAARQLWSAGIEPSVLLMAVDDRIFRYKHAVAHGERLRKFGMVNLCARSHGLCLSITRFVHFGAPPKELTNAFAVAAEVNAALLSASRAGTTSAELYAAASQAYAKAGYPAEEANHHQGGPCGYMERDWVATPSGNQFLIDGQALAWNPSFRGGKVEDTLLLTNNLLERITDTPDLPVVHTSCNGASFESAGILVR